MGDNCKVFVGNLSYETNEDELYNLFAAAGKVEEVKIICDRETGRPRGFAFVTLEGSNDVQKAINQLHATEFKGRNLTVREAENKREGGGYRGGGGRYGGGGGYGRGGGYGGGGEYGGGGGYRGGRSREGGGYRDGGHYDRGRY